MMARLPLLAILLSGCAGSMAAGAGTVTAAAIGASALQRAAGGCYAMCTGGTTCNPRTGLCEIMPCEGKCGRDEHCEQTATQSWCAPGPPGDVVTKAPGSEQKVPVAPPPPPLTGDPQRVVPAAEQNPPSHK